MTASRSSRPWAAVRRRPVVDSGGSSRFDNRRNVKGIRGRCGCGLRLLRRDGEVEKLFKAHATATKKDFYIHDVLRVMLINVFNLIVSKLNELVVDDHKRTAKKYLDIPFNTLSTRPDSPSRPRTTPRRGSCRCMSVRPNRSRPPTTTPTTSASKTSSRTRCNILHLRRRPLSNGLGSRSRPMSDTSKSTHSFGMRIYSVTAAHP